MAYEEVDYQSRSYGIVMEPVADCKLEEYLQNIVDTGVNIQSQTQEITQEWFSCLASGLAFMHAKRIRRKDIKPSNILLDNNKFF
jgi:serine/threonine protein kinase